MVLIGKERKSMDEEQVRNLLAQLADHEKRIRLLENDVSNKKNFSGDGRPDSQNKKDATKRKGKGEDLSPPIQVLFKNDFFKDSRIDLDVVSELQRKLLTQKKPLRASVVNVLRRMVRSGILDRIEVAKNKKTLIAYRNS